MVAVSNVTYSRPCTLPDRVALSRYIHDRATRASSLAWSFIPGDNASADMTVSEGRCYCIDHRYLLAFDEQDRPTLVTPRYSESGAGLGYFSSFQDAVKACEEHAAR